jgi:ABC-type transport system involved in multi-copper enzyme maturation permease subunit
VITRIRLTLKQSRFEVAAAIILCIGVAVAAIVEALRLNSVNLPAGCYPYAAQNGFQPGMTLACFSASSQWLAIHDSFDVRLITPLPQVLPFVVGIMLGAPLVAREIEHGTAPLSWALAGSRRRWLAARIGAVVPLIVPLLLMLGLASDFLAGATVPGLNPWADFGNYMGRGIPLVFWGLAAFAGTAALGTLIGRTAPAMLLAVVICVLVRGTWDPGMNRTVLPPLSQVLATQADIANGTPWGNETNSALIVYTEMYLDGKPWSGDINAWYQANMTTTVDSNGNVIQSMGPTDPSQMPTDVPFGIPGGEYWPIVALECGILFLGSLLFAGVALFRVDGRRPY